MFYFIIGKSQLFSVPQKYKIFSRKTKVAFVFYNISLYIWLVKKNIGVMKGNIEEALPEIVMIFAIFLMLGLSVAFSTLMRSQVEKEFNKKIDSLECVINEMRATDSLILDMSEYNSKDIEVLTENHDILSTQIKKVERRVKSIDTDLNAVD